MKVVIIHETNPWKYYPALFRLQSTGAVDSIVAVRYSALKEGLRSVVVRERGVVASLSLSCKTSIFRVRSLFMRGHVIVMGFAPYDWRIVLYSRLARNNAVFYHTSWTDWRLSQVPRRPYFFRARIRSSWLRFLSSPNVRVVATLPAVRESLLRELGVDSTIIPHAVPGCFFVGGRERENEVKSDTAIGSQDPLPLRLLFVGELSEKKGIRRCLEVARELAGAVELTVVGAGPLDGLVRSCGMSNVNFLGAIWDREALAREIARHDVLLQLSQRSGAWQELFGIAMIEAMASGLCVVASDHVGPRSVLAKLEESLVFDESDTDGVTDALRRLACDRVRLRKLQVSHFEGAQPYSLDGVSRAWCALLKEDPSHA